MNTYGYVGGNPLKYIDRLGLIGDLLFPEDDENHFGPEDPADYVPASLLQGPFGPLCGPEGSAGALWIPDVNNRACKRHDQCYEDCALECKPKSCKLKCDLELGYKVPLYGLATALGGDEVYDDLKQEYGCNAACGR